MLAAQPFSQISITERQKELKKFLLTLHVITGWPIPDNELMLIFLNQLEKKLIEDYPYLNLVEIEAAFRKNPGTANYGASFNLRLIDEVLYTFKGIRAEVDRKCQEAAKNSLKIDPMTDEEMINEARGQIAFYYEQRKKGNNRPRIFPFWAEVLKMDGFIQYEADIEIFFTKCLEDKKSLIYFKS
jgi:hypothetical protein